MNAEQSALQSSYTVKILKMTLPPASTEKGFEKCFMVSAILTTLARCIQGLSTGVQFSEVSKDVSG